MASCFDFVQELSEKYVLGNNECCSGGKAVSIARNYIKIVLLY
jgi:hypothetical protein